MLPYTLIDTTPDEGIQIFRKVTSAEELQTGNRYLIVCEDKSTAMGAIQKDFRSSCSITFEANKIHTEVDREGLPLPNDSRRNGRSLHLV